MNRTNLTLPGFREEQIAIDGTSVFVRIVGQGDPLLLLHGFPQTGLMWREIAFIISHDFRVIVADLPGYGQSTAAVGELPLGHMSKREMAATLLEAMRAVGYDRFALAGHDRGGRVAYRIALDHPDSVTRVALLDVVSTYDVWDRADARMAQAFWPFSLLAQPAPFPERLIAAAPEAIVDNALGDWGTPPEVFPQWVREAYVAALKDPRNAHAICEEYRAAAGVDRDADAADLAAGRRITCPVLAHWSEKGGLETWYADAGGPLGLWRRFADDGQGGPVRGGHFFPEEHPRETAATLNAFFRAAT